MLYVTDSPVVAGHRQLSESRNVSRSDVGAFTVVARVQAESSLSQSAGVPPALLRSHLEGVDPRLERVTSQQYLRLAVIRRDAIFEMCVMSGKLVLSGDGLAPTTTAYAIWPIKFRSIVWTLAFVVVFACAVLFLASRSALPYFATANTWIRWLALLGLALSIPSLGILLRQVCKPFRLRALAASELALVTSCALCFVAAATGALGSRPRLAEVEAALTNQDVAGARIVLDALLDTRGNVDEVMDAQDRIDLAEAAGQGLDSRLGLLDRVAARRGTSAHAASKLARDARLSAISEYIKAGSTSAAVSVLTKWFGAESRDADVGELYAQAQKQLLNACPDTTCRFDAAKKANAAAPTAVRAADLAAHRGELLRALTFQPVSAEPLAARLGRLRELGELAAAARGAVAGDAELVKRVAESDALASAERAKVPLIGSQEPVVEELLGRLTRKSPTISMQSSGSADTFVVFDQQRRCRGIYVVGSQPKARAIPGTVGASTLSQAVGRLVAIKRPSGSAVTSRWVEGAVSVVARWNSSTLVELRIGDAAP